MARTILAAIIVIALWRALAQADAYYANLEIEETV